MANPSLQIGNSNWAIKEDNLLGYSTAGTRFVPQPITMTRESAGTRVNSSGLVETVELLGSELVTDVDFLLTGTQAQNTTGTYWNTGTGWTISGGNAILDGSQIGGSSLSSKNMTVAVGKIYKVTVNVSATSTGFRLYDALGVVSYGLSLGENIFYRTPSSPTYTVTPLGLTGATGTITNVSVKEYTANNLARVDYNGTASSLLVEPERKNEVTYSEDFSQSSWTKLNTGTGLLPVVTSNFTTSPDGTNNASKVVFDAGTGTTSGNSSQIYDSVTFPNNTDGTASVYLKGENGGEQLVFRGVADGSYILLTLTTEWQRFSTTENSGTNTDAITFGIRQSVSGLGIINSSATVYAWGGQIEEGSYATSYIPTDGGTVTRIQDQYSKTGISNLINSEEGVLFLEMAALSDDLTDRRISLNDGSVSNQIIIGYSRFTGNIIAEIFSGGSLQNVNWGATGVTQTDNNKFALSWGSGTMKIYINGSPTNTETGVTSPVGLNNLEFSIGDDTMNMFGKVKKLQVFKTALTNSELIALTTI